MVKGALRKPAKISLLFICVFITVMLLSGFFISGDQLFDIKKYNDIYDAGIYSTLGFDIDGNTYHSFYEDPNITVFYTPSNVLILDLDLQDDQPQQGQIYYSAEGSFEEKYSYPYMFKEGINIIDVDAENANYLRLDITDEEDVSFSVSSFKEYSSQAYTLHYSNILKVFAISVAITIAAVVYSECRLTDRKKDIFFAGLLGVSLLVIFRVFIFGDAYYMYSDVGSDTIKQYYPYFVNEVLSIKDGSFSVWNWDYGLGTCFLNMNAWTFDPFALFIVLIGVLFGPGSVQYALVWGQILKIVAVYILGRKYLKTLGYGVVPSDIAAYFLALNGYIFLWGQHLFMGTAVVYLLLILVTLEKAIQDDKRTINLPLTISVALTLIFSYYFGYMILILAAVYFMVRYCMYQNAIYNVIKIKRLVRDWMRVGISVVLGVMISCVIFLPACYYTVTVSADRLNTEDTNKFMTLFLSFIGYDRSRTLERMSKMLSNNSICVMRDGNSTFANAYEAPQYFINILSFFFMGQWFTSRFTHHRTIRGIIETIVVTALFGILMLNDASGYLFNGFAYVAYRYTFMTMPFVAICIASTFSEIENGGKINPYGIILGGLGSWLAWDYAHSNCSGEVTNYVVFLGVVLIAGAVLLMLTNVQKIRSVISVVLVALMVSVSVIDAGITTTHRQYITESKYDVEWGSDSMDEPSAAAIAWLREEDKSFYRITKNYTDWNEVADTFLLQYSSAIWYNSTPNANVVDYYDNIYPQASTAFFAIKGYNLSPGLSEEANDVIHTKYILSHNELDSEEWEEINRFDDVIVYRNIDSYSVAKWYADTITENSFSVLNEDDKAVLLDDTVVLEENIAVDKDSSCIETEVMSLVDQTHMKGRYNCDGKGILMIAIPYQDGWSIYVDGKKADLIKCDYGFIGVVLEAGEHEVEARYDLPYLKEGTAVTVIGGFAAAAITVYDTIKKKCKVSST